MKAIVTGCHRCLCILLGSVGRIPKAQAHQQCVLTIQTDLSASQPASRPASSASRYWFDSIAKNFCSVPRSAMPPPQLIKVAECADARPQSERHLCKRRSKQRSGPRVTGPVNKFPYRLWLHCARNSGKQKGRWRGIGIEIESTRFSTDSSTRVRDAVASELLRFPQSEHQILSGPRESNSSSGRDGWKRHPRKREHNLGLYHQSKMCAPLFSLACSKGKEAKEGRLWESQPREILPKFSVL